MLENLESEAHDFAFFGGVIAAILVQNLKIDIKTLSVDGLDKKSINIIRAVSSFRKSQFKKVLAKKSIEFPGLKFLLSELRWNFRKFIPKQAKLFIY